MAPRRQRPEQGQEPKRSFLLRQWDRIESTDAAGVRTAYYLIIICTVILTCFGMVMVLSSSAVENISHNQDPYGLFIRQGAFGVVGLIGMFVLAMLSPRWLKRLSWLILVISGLLLIMVLIPGIGSETMGNRNWIRFTPSLGVQPSEFAKFALILWSATVYATKERLLSLRRHTIIPVLPVGMVVIGLVLLEHDLGTAMVIMLVLVTLLWAGGAPKAVFGGLGAAMVVLVLFMALTNENRLGRIFSWLGKGGDDDASGTGLQVLQAKYALASGGWFGVGLGQSRSKWSYIPEAQNDFILSIIGEELGLIGTLGVVLVFIVLILSMYRIAYRSKSLFARVTISGVIAWIGGQAFINMGMVTGLAPVIGVTLPFISYGGSSLLTCLCAVGLVLNAGLHQLRHGVPGTPASRATQKKERKA